MEITGARIRAGIWEAELSGAGATPPRLEIVGPDGPLPPPAAEPVAGRTGCYRLRAPIPPAAISEGAQGFVVRDPGSGRQLAQFTIAAGEGLAGNLEAEVALLRAELDLLKAAFRHHCADAGQGSEG